MATPAIRLTERKIVWDADQQRFRDADTGRYVSNLTGIYYLRGEVSPTGLRFRDTLGHYAPDPVKLLYGDTRMQYGNVSRTWSSRGGEVYAEAPRNEGYYVSVVMYLDDDGNLRYAQTWHKAGEPLSADDERRRVAASIAAQEGYEMGERGSDEIMGMVVRLLHWEAY